MQTIKYILLITITLFTFGQDIFIAIPKGASVSKIEPKTRQNSLIF